MEGDKNPRRAPRAIPSEYRGGYRKRERELAIENLIQKRSRWMPLAPGAIVALAISWASHGSSGLKQGRLSLSAVIQKEGAGKGFQVGELLPYQARTNQAGNTFEWEMCM